MKQELIRYLKERDKELEDERIGLDNRYDTMPNWAWSRKHQIVIEQRKISKFIEYLEDVE